MAVATSILKSTRPARALCVILAGLALAGGARAGDADAEKKDHEELRALLNLFTQSFNQRQIEPLIPYLHKNFTVTMVNQDLITTPDMLKGYLDRQFNGPAAPLKDVQIKPDADIPTVFFEGRIGINRGGSVDTYTLKDGRSITLKTRWTGTAIQEDGKWKVLNAHIGANLIDNPILDALDQQKWLYAGVAGALGLAVGVAGTLLSKRRRT